MRKNKNELPETITLIADIVKVGFDTKERKGNYEIIWKTKPRLPHEFWSYLWGKKIASVKEIQLTCETCGSVLDKKVVYSFHIEKLKTELSFLRYKIVSETEKEIVFQRQHLEVNDNNLDLSGLLKMPSDSFALLPRCQNLLSFSFKKLLVAMFLNVGV